MAYRTGKQAGTAAHPYKLFLLCLAVKSFDQKICPCDGCFKFVRDFLPFRGELSNMTKDPLALYKKYHLDRGDERLGLFRLLATRFGGERVLYPGCFVHVTPSLVFPVVTYVDTEKRAMTFFSDEGVKAFVADHKEYRGEATVVFHHIDYRQDLPEPQGGYDLLISQYAGFVSMYCTHYLKIGGLLLANNSHGDASMASIDPRYELVGVINHRGEKFSVKSNQLADYLIPKSGRPVIKETLLASGRGVGYTRSASAYLFQRTS